MSRPTLVVTNSLRINSDWAMIDLRQSDRGWIELTSGGDLRCFRYGLQRDRLCRNGSIHRRKATRQSEGLSQIFWRGFSFRMRHFHQPKSPVNRSFVRPGRHHFRKHPSNSKPVGINFHVLGVSKKFATGPEEILSIVGRQCWAQTGPETLPSFAWDLSPPATFRASSVLGFISECLDGM